MASDRATGRDAAYGLWQDEAGGFARGQVGMLARGFGYASVAIACIALAACDGANGAKTDQTSAARISAALDICAEGRGAFARRVCSNQALAALDGQVAETLVAEAAEVSDAGAQMLVQNQARWREAARLNCGLVEPDAQPTPEQQACLEGQYRSRLEASRTVVQEVGGYTFQRMELVEAAPVTAEIAEAAGFAVQDAPPAVMRDIRFPRIDGRQTPEIARFNELVAQQPQASLNEGVTEIVDYNIAFAGPELVSVRFLTSMDQLGAAHGSNSMRAVTVLMGEGRLLAEGDVFRANSGWQDFLTRRAVAEITRQFAEYDFRPPERDVRESATKPHLWLITEQGLVLLFPPYSFGGPHALGGTEVTIPWNDLRPYLNPAAPAPIRATS